MTKRGIVSSLADTQADDIGPTPIIKYVFDLIYDGENTASSQIMVARPSLWSLCIE